jgi:hypothetical protein
MSDPASDLKLWFQKLSEADKLAALTFLYGGKALLKKGMYVGPYPEMVQNGLHVGPVPTSSNVCGACGRPL